MLETWSQLSGVHFLVKLVDIFKKMCEFFQNQIIPRLEGILEVMESKA